MSLSHTKTVTLVALFSFFGCGGSTVKSPTDSGTHNDDGGTHDNDAGVTRDTGTPEPDTGLPEKPNDGGIVNDAPPGICPATYAIAGSAGNCGTTDVLCIYDEGTCSCGEPGPPHEGPNDWYCAPLNAGCPYAPPVEGAACGSANLYCDYGACIGGTAWDCTDGVWTQGAVACPA